MTDERKGKPSASSMERIMLCPGSLELCREHPSDNETAYSQFGDRVHKLIEDHIKGIRAVVESEDEESKIAASLLRKASPLVQEWRSKYADFPETVHVEKRFWCLDRFSAKPDLVLVRDDAALTLNWKSGWGDVSPSVLNPQLAAEACCIAADESLPNIERVFAGLIQAHVASPVLVEFDPKDLGIWEGLLCDGLRKAESHPDMRKPGEKQCAFCPAKIHCPEANQDMAQLTVVQPRDITDPAQLGKLLERCTMAIKMVDAIRAHAKDLIKSGVTIPGYQLAPNNREKIKDIFGVWNKLQPYGATPEEFGGKCTLTKKDLEEYAAQLRPTLTGKKLDTFLRELMDGNTEIVQGEKKLVKKT